MWKSWSVKGDAYFSNGNVYFDTSKFPAYGSLSGQKRDDLKHGARVETDENKRNESDFVLWFTSSKFKNQILQGIPNGDAVIRAGILNALRCR